MSERLQIGEAFPDLSRRELHGQLSPVIYSHHAREDLVQDIQGLPLLDRTYGSILDLVRSQEIRDGLRLADTYEGRTKHAAANGVVDIDKWDVYAHGYADRYIVPLFAAAMSGVISDYLLKKGDIEEPLSFIDRARLFQTGWFGEMANQMAIMQQGRLQNFCEDLTCRATDKALGSFSEFITNIAAENQTDRYGFDRKDVLIRQKDEASGLTIVKLSKEAKAALRSGLKRDISVGCPVARTAITATQQQVDFLQEWGHLGEPSGFYIMDEGLPDDSNKVLLKSGAYTAIDEVLWHWGDYVERYSLHRQAVDPEASGMVPTAAHKTVLLD